MPGGEKTTVFREALAGALDGDVIVATAVLAGALAAGRDGAGDVVAVDGVKRLRPGKVARLAISVGNRLATGGAGGQTPVNAIAVAIAGDDEEPLLGVSCVGRAHQNRGGAGCHQKARHVPTRRYYPNRPKRMR